jgi:quercetin dioxygenase-like cupin family protein
MLLYEDGPSLILVIQGNMNMTVSGLTHNIKRGVVIFIAAELKINFVCVDPQEILMYRAYCDLQS